MNHATTGKKKTTAAPGRLLRAPLARVATMVALAAAAGIGCGGGATGKPGGSGGSGSSGGAGGGSPAGEIDRPCADAMHVGAFELAVVAPVGTVAGYAQLIGTVQDKPDPTKIWQAQATEGECRLMLGPTCNASCTLPNVCDGDTCVPGPTIKTVGTVTITGLNAALSAMPNSKMNYYAPASAAGFPPFTADADVRLTASGGDLAGFSLRGRGFPVVESPSTSLPFEMGHPFIATWTPPPAPVSTRIFVKIDIAVHGSLQAQIQCDVPDTGSITVPASMVDALMAKGTSGFPTAYLIRRTVDSATVGTGCVDFAITSTFNGTTGIQLAIPGVTSCNKDSECGGGKTCGIDLKCG